MSTAELLAAEVAALRFAQKHDRADHVQSELDKLTKRAPKVETATVDTDAETAVVKRGPGRPRKDAE